MQRLITPKQKRTLLFTALKKHLGIILLMSFMTVVFLGSGLAILYFAKDGEMFFLGAFFSLIGAALLVAGIFMNTSSVRYYYEGELGRKYGRYHQASITEIKEDIHIERETNKHSRHYGQEVDRHYYYAITVLLNQQPITAMYEPPKGKHELAQKLVEGMNIQVRMVPGMEQTLRISPRKLTAQLEKLAAAE